MGTPDRILSIDILRGVAVLGILIMNIQSFSMHSVAYINPTAYGDFTGINRWVWIISHLVASEKFMGIFSMLFGAGVLIFTGNAASKGKNFTLLHFRRMGWLLFFGLGHAYLFWYGDILVTYGLCGMLVFLFRKLKPGTLLWIAAGLFLVPLVFNTFAGMTMPYWTEDAYQEMVHTWRPGPEEIQIQMVAMGSGWLGQMKTRIAAAIGLQTTYFFIETFWRVMSMMLLGMALYKWKILSAERPRSFYVGMALMGLATGYLLSGLGVWLNFRKGWSLEYSMFLGGHFNYVGSVGVALGYTGVVMLICRSAGFSKFKQVFSSVGRLAFTNYILQSIICTFIFYGHGFGLYGTVERKYQVLVVLGVWIILLIISPLWLKRFRFGPLEWLWRSLTYWCWQPFKIRS